MLEYLSLSRHTRCIIDRRKGVGICIEVIYVFGNLDYFILAGDGNIRKLRFFFLPCDRIYSFFISLSHIRLDYRHGYYLFSLFEPLVYFADILGLGSDEVIGPIEWVSRDWISDHRLFSLHPLFECHLSFGFF